jgi:ankyrin repeat protein
VQDGDTALTLASERGCAEIVDLLLAGGANRDAQDKVIL